MSEILPMEMKEYQMLELKLKDMMEYTTYNAVARMILVNARVVKMIMIKSLTWAGYPVKYLD